MKDGGDTGGKVKPGCSGKSKGKRGKPKPKKILIKNIGQYKGTHKILHCNTKGKAIVKPLSNPHLGFVSSSSDSELEYQFSDSENDNRENAYNEGTGKTKIEESSDREGKKAVRFSNVGNDNEGEAGSSEEFVCVDLTGSDVENEAEPGEAKNQKDEQEMQVEQQDEEQSEEKGKSVEGSDKVKSDEVDNEESNTSEQMKENEMEVKNTEGVSGAGNQLVRDAEMRAKLKIQMDRVPMLQLRRVREWMSKGKKGIGKTSKPVAQVMSTAKVDDEVFDWHTCNGECALVNDRNKFEKYLHQRICPYKLTGWFSYEGSDVENVVFPTLYKRENVFKKRMSGIVNILTEKEESEGEEIDFEDESDISEREKWLNEISRKVRMEFDDSAVMKGNVELINRSLREVLKDQVNVLEKQGELCHASVEMYWGYGVKESLMMHLALHLKVIGVVQKKMDWYLSMREAESFQMQMKRVMQGVIDYIHDEIDLMAGDEGDKKHTRSVAKGGSQ